MRELGLESEAYTVRMTGCPNGCVRPYQSDIGLVGRSGDKYVLFLGGRLEGDRLNFPVKDLVGRADIAKTLRTIFIEYKASREEKESFGDFCNRLGQERLKEMLANTV